MDEASSDALNPVAAMANYLVTGAGSIWNANVRSNHQLHCIMWLLRIATSGAALDFIWNLTISLLYAQSWHWESRKYNKWCEDALRKKLLELKAVEGPLAIKVGSWLSHAMLGPHDTRLKRSARGATHLCTLALATLTWRYR